MRASAKFDEEVLRGSLVGFATWQWRRLEKVAAAADAEARQAAEQITPPPLSRCWRNISELARKIDGEVGEDEETCVRAEDLDALLARFSMQQWPVLSNDDCGFIAIESGTKTKPAEVEVPLMRKEVAGYLERTSQLHGLFASIEAREAFVAGLHGRAWMNASPFTCW